MNNKLAIKELMDNQRSIAQQLHDMRISKQLALEEVSVKTGIPAYIIDSQEIGMNVLKISVVFQLAKFYGKTVKITLSD